MLDKSEMLNVFDSWQPSSQDLRVKVIAPEDDQILRAIYRSTREEELNLAPWTEEQKKYFIDSQFDAQQFHYKKYYDQAYFWLLLQHDNVIGRLYVDVSESQLRIIDISLLPSFRNKGIGASIFHDLQYLAGKNKLPVTIHVEQYNPARNLYQRLGFVEKEVVNSIYLLMEWNSDNGLT